MVFESSMIKLLCRLLSSKGDDGDLMADLVSLSCDDWDELIQLAKQHGVETQIFQFITQNQLSDRIPADSYKVLHTATIRNATRNMLFLHEAGLVLRAFKEKGIAAIGLKGIYLLDHIYEDISLRKLSDIDILVRRGDIPAAIDTAQGLGYRPTTFFDSTDANLDIKHVPPLKKEGGPYLEIHWTILEEDEPFTIDIDGLWERAVITQIAGVEAMALSHEDLFLHLCIHMAYQHHLTVGLRGLVDVFQLLNVFKDEINWQNFTETAMSWGVQRPVAITFQLLNELFGADIPEGIYSLIEDEPIPKDLFQIAIREITLEERSQVNLTPDLVDLATEKGLLNKAKLIWQRVFLPKRIIGRIYNINPKENKIYFYYILRFVELLRFYSSSVWGVLTKQDQTQLDVALKRESMHLKQWLGDHH